MVDIGFYCKVRDYGQVRLAANYVLRLPSSFTWSSCFSILSSVFTSLLFVIVTIVEGVLP